MTTTLTNRQPLDLNAVNRQMMKSDAVEIVRWANQTFGDRLVMSTSFGIQAAVMLHLNTQIDPKIRVIWIDTGFLPPETYRFAVQLAQRLKLNLNIYQSPMSPARMTALYGRLWEKQDVASLDRYDQIRKVEPMERALRELKASAWISGIRREQTQVRQQLPVVQKRTDGLFKIHPILNWTNQEVHTYLKTHNLPYHPLWEQGYTTVGDWHSSRSITDQDNHERDTRFRGLKQECGLHIPQTPEENKSRDSSGL